MFTQCYSFLTALGARTAEPRLSHESVFPKQQLRVQPWSSISPDHWHCFFEAHPKLERLAFAKLSDRGGLLEALSHDYAEGEDSAAHTTPTLPKLKYLSFHEADVGRYSGDGEATLKKVESALVSRHRNRLAVPLVQFWKNREHPSPGSQLTELAKRVFRATKGTTRVVDKDTVDFE